MPLPPPTLLRLFWCHHCRRPITILPSLSSSSDLFCPRCFSPFIRDLDILPPPPPPPPRPPANLFFDFQSPHLFPPWNPPPLPPMDHHGDYFAGPNLSELIQQLTENDRTGPPPASNSSIDALPAVAITAAHLRGGSECPVCKEEFLVGEEAREMPCSHVYHSDCIVPWLRMHNSCPVCRFQLSGGEAAAGERSRGGYGGGGGGGGNGRRRRRRAPERWNPFAVLSAFRGSSPPGWDRRYGGDRREEGGHPMDSADAFYSWWRSWFLL